MQRAVLYLRSSKDRHDVAIEVQRRELTELARARGYVVAGEFADVVESGKDEDRPGLQALLAELYAKRPHLVDRAGARHLAHRPARRGRLLVRGPRVPASRRERGLQEPAGDGGGRARHRQGRVPRRRRVALARVEAQGPRRHARERARRQARRRPRAVRLPARARAHRRGARRRGGGQVAPGGHRAAPALRAYLLDRAAGIPRHAAGRRHLPSIAHTTLLSIEKQRAHLCRAHRVESAERARPHRAEASGRARNGK
jgi:hypothetical protein